VLFTLINTALLAWRPHSPEIRWFSRGTLCIFYVMAGVQHFTNPKFYLAMMPPFLPAEFCVYASGVAEAVLGIAVMVPKFTNLAAWALIALLFAVFPANIYMAVSEKVQKALKVPAQFALIRLPLQIAFLAHVYLMTELPLRATVAALGL